VELGSAEIVIVGIILARLLVPLAIIRFPLPGIVACLVLDAVDQTVFQALAPDADLAGYQSYDKALDIYYLVIAYTATLRNWTNRFAVSIARFLIFYRLVGVVLFELSGQRWLLFIFPNTFEYFFIFYESVRLFWDPRRMSHRVLLGATAFIWIFIKLPQEWWIHIAQLDTTDVVQERVFGVPAGTPWLDTFAARPWVVVAAIVVAVAVVTVVWWLARTKLPPRDRPLTIGADAEPGWTVPPERLAAEQARRAATIWHPELLEKVALLALVSIIFGQMLGLRAEPLELAALVGVIIVLNAALSAWLARKGFGPGPALRQFVVTGLLNAGILVALLALFGVLGSPIALERVTFMLLLVTLLVTLYDRYQPEYVARFATSPGVAAAS
jgi:hypothetical protein